MSMRTIIALGFILFIAGCKTVPTEKPIEISEGQWKAKALVKDKEQSRSYIVNLNLNAVKNEKLRMDVTSALGTGVASMVVQDSEVRYILVDSKRFYFGQPQPNVMRPILAAPIDPRWLHNLLFDIPMPDKSWVCTSDASGLVQDCKDRVSALEVSWTARAGQKKTIQIDHPKAYVQIIVQEFKPKVEDRKNLFNLEAPEGYQKLRVR